MEMDQEFAMESEGMELTNGPMILFADDAMMDEMYEESNEIVATFLPMMMPEEEESFAQEKPVMMTDTFQEEEIIEEEPTMMTESFPQEEMIEEEPTMKTESFPQEEEIIEEESTEMVEEESVEEKPAKVVQAKNEKKEVKEKKLTSETAKKSAVQTKKIAEQKAIQQKKAIVKNLARIMDKVDKDIKNISKNLAVKNIIKMQAMTCLLYTSPSPRDGLLSRMPSSA